jgi:hypothetical protein
VPKFTIQQLVQAALESEGWGRDPGAATRKYIALHRPGGTDHIYIGVSGSVRRGRIVSESHPVPLSTKRRLIEQGRKILEPSPS